jgi:ABC-type sugar transport system ATPase subunit
VLVVVRPQAIVVAPGASGDNAVRGTVEAVAFLGDVVEVELRVRGHLLKLLADPYAAVASGQELDAVIPPERCVVVDDDRAPGEAARDG